MRYKFGEIAENSKEKRMPIPEDKEKYIGLDHLDTKDLEVHRFGSDVDITGQKLVMHKGDLLFGRRNTYLRRAAIAPHDGLFSAHGMILIPNKEVVDPNFFPFFILSDYFMDAAIRISVGSLSPTVNWSALKELEFDLPPMDEQRKLAKLFWGYERVRRAYRRVLLQLDDLVKSQFVEMFGDPENQKEGLTCLGEHITIVNGFAFKGELFGGTGLPVIKIGNVNRTDFAEGSMQFYEYDENLKRFEIYPGDVVISLTGTVGKEDFGNVCQVSDDYDRYYLNQRNAKLELHNELVAEYVVYLLRNDFIRKGLIQSGTGVRQCHLHNKDLNNIRFRLPEKNLQEQFAAFIHQTDKSKLAIKESLENLERGKQAIMVKAFG